MADSPTQTPIVAALPASVPFVPPEALERQAGVKLRLRLGANESLFGPSPAVVRAMAAASAEIQLYGDPDCWDLRERIGRLIGLDSSHIVIGGGIDDLLGLFVRAYVAPGEIAVISAGGYPTMIYQLDGYGARIRRVPYQAFRNDADALVDAAMEARARLVYLANPDNPTGSLLDADTLGRMIRRLPADCLLLLDEAYAELAPAGSLPLIDGEDPRIVRLRTFSKVYGLAGMRVGYAFGAPATIRPIDRIRNHFAIGRLAQAAAIAALEDQDYVADTARLIQEGCRDYADLAESLGFRALPSATNFVAIDVGDAARARSILTRLQHDHGVFIRVPGTAPLDRLVRVTVGRKDDRALFAEALRAVVRHLG